MIKGNQAKLNNNNSNQHHHQHHHHHQRESSHEDLRLIDSSSTSTTNSAMLTTTTTSPRSTTPNSGLTSPHHQHQQQTATTTTIPTRFVDRRVSAGLVQTDPYKFNVNYSEAGQRLAKQAQAQLKSLEKSKEADTIEVATAPVSSSSSRRPSSNGDIFDPNAIGDDWQNVNLVFPRHDYFN